MGSEGEGEVLYVDKGDCLERDIIIEKEAETEIVTDRDRDRQR